MRMGANSVRTFATIKDPVAAARVMGEAFGREVNPHDAGKFVGGPLSREHTGSMTRTGALRAAAQRKLMEEGARELKKLAGRPVTSVVREEGSPIPTRITVWDPKFPVGGIVRGPAGAIYRDGREFGLHEESVDLVLDSSFPDRPNVRGGYGTYYYMSEGGFLLAKDEYGDPKILDYFPRLVLDGHDRIWEQSSHFPNYNVVDSGREYIGEDIMAIVDGRAIPLKRFVSVNLDNNNTQWKRRGEKCISDIYIDKGLSRVMLVLEKTVTETTVTYNMNSLHGIPRATNWSYDYRIPNPEDLPETLMIQGIRFRVDQETGHLSLPPALKNVVSFNEQGEMQLKAREGSIFSDGDLDYMVRMGKSGLYLEHLRPCHVDMVEAEPLSMGQRAMASLGIGLFQYIDAGYGISKEEDPRVYLTAASTNRIEAIKYGNGRVERATSNNLPEYVTVNGVIEKVNPNGTLEEI